MKVGTICKLKVDCLGNKAGTLGVVFNDYGNGFQVIFENGNYDGFSTKIQMAGSGRNPVMQSEALVLLEEVGFEASLLDYQFKNVGQVYSDYRDGLFNIAWSEGWKKFADGKTSVEPTVVDAEYFPDEYEKCEVYADGSKPPWLRFKRKWPVGVGVTVCMLSAAMDYVDFSHFEYAEFPNSALPRWIQGNRTLYPKYVVFRKKL